MPMLRVDTPPALYLEIISGEEDTSSGTAGMLRDLDSSFAICGLRYAIAMLLGEDF